MKRTAYLLVLILASYFLGAVHGQAAQLDTDAEVATEWFSLQLALVETTPGFSPPVASRAFAYTGVTLYEALVPAMPGYQSLAGQLNDLEPLPQPLSNLEYDWETVANSALAEITRRLFAHTSEENQAAIDTLYTRFASAREQVLSPQVFTRSEMYGRSVASAIYRWSMTDGGHEGELTSFRADFVPPEGAGMWIPTPRRSGDPQPALQPYWGDNRPFALTAGDECMPVPPPEYAEEPESAFYREALEVYDVERHRTPEQEAIALFWADNPAESATPPGHSISILTQILEQENAPLSFAAEAYARLGVAVADAFIGCWNAKYTYNLVRPVTYIQGLIDETWLPILTTPPFPEYPSGHSVQSGAAAEVLTALFGEDYGFTDHTHDAKGYAPRSFASFNAFAEEAALSRLYGGIHYRAAIEQGLAQGRCIGERVNRLVFRSNPA